MRKIHDRYNFWLVLMFMGVIVLVIWVVLAGGKLIMNHVYLQEYSSKNVFGRLERIENILRGSGG